MEEPRNQRKCKKFGLIVRETATERVSREILLAAFHDVAMSKSQNL
jgi:hypothetical protein